MASAETHASGFSIARVLRNTATVIRQEYLFLFAVTFALLLPYVLLFHLVNTVLPVTAEEDFPGSFLSPRYWLRFAVEIGPLAVLLFAAYAVQIYATEEILNGRPLDRRVAIRAILRSAISRSLLAIPFYFILAVTTTAFVLPGLLINAVWFVVLPAFVFEGCGVFGSFARSAELTNGYRRWIFVLCALFFLLSETVAIAFWMLFQPADPSAVLSDALLFVEIGLPATVSGVISAAAYLELRTAKEGVAPQQLASVFD